MDRNQLLKQIRELKTEKRPNSITTERLGGILEGVIMELENTPKVVVKTLPEWLTNPNEILPKEVICVIENEGAVFVGDGNRRVYELIGSIVPVLYDRKVNKCVYYIDGTGDETAASIFYFGGSRRDFNDRATETFSLYTPDQKICRMDFRIFSDHYGSLLVYKDNNGMSNWYSIKDGGWCVMESEFFTSEGSLVFDFNSGTITVYTGFYSVAPFYLSFNS